MVKPVVNQETCIGCGTCVVMAEKTFRLNSQGKAEVIEPVGDDEKTIREAADACPVNAISFEG